MHRAEIGVHQIDKEAGHHRWEVNGRATTSRTTVDRAGGSAASGNAPSSEALGIGTIVLALLGGSLLGINPLR